MLRALARHWRERCLRQRAARRTAVRLVQALPKTSCRVWADARTRGRACVHACSTHGDVCARCGCGAGWAGVVVQAGVGRCGLGSARVG